MKKIELGNKVADAVTGFTGIATSRTEYLNGCWQIAITGKANPDTGETRILEVDVEQVVYKGPGLLKPVAKKKPTGGPSRSGTLTRSAGRVL